MADYPLFAALEIGTTRTTVLVGEQTGPHTIRIIGQGVRDSSGVRKGRIVNMNQAGALVQYALDDAADSSQTSLLQVYLSISGGAIGCDLNTARYLIDTPDAIVDGELCDELKHDSSQMELQPGRQVIHGIGLDFSLDDQGAVDDPIGRTGRELAHTSLIIHGDKSQIDDAIKLVEARKCSVRDVVFSGLCDTYSVLSPEQRQNGVLLIDFGGGVTEYMVVVGNRIRRAGTLAVGGEHITNDIALGLRVPFDVAEALKKEHGSAVIDGTVGRISVPRGTILSRAPETVAARDLQTIIEARVSETFDIIRRETGSFLPELNAGIVITGGTSRLPGVIQSAERVFGRPAAVGLPSNVEWSGEFQPAPELATAAGLLVYATYASGDSRPTIREFLKGIFSR